VARRAYGDVMSKSRLAVVAVSLGLTACAARTSSSTGARAAPSPPPPPSVSEPYCALFPDDANAKNELASLLHEGGEGSWEMVSVTSDDGILFVCFKRPGQTMTFSGDDVVVVPDSSAPPPEVVVD
jgi:hypothetical protein